MFNHPVFILSRAYCATNISESLSIKTLIRLVMIAIQNSLAASCYHASRRTTTNSMTMTTRMDLCVLTIVLRIFFSDVLSVSCIESSCACCSMLLVCRLAT
ncbi:unnamed protein product [Periconia digitata]|uniref:Uncharacterized protein n=1 Tax=Periconia digitata TaxID=1303443 RepID=A0A9W4U6C9_9PLEO|nr:unnamed protein product [Periconia digitata]